MIKKFCALWALIFLFTSCHKNVIIKQSIHADGMLFRCETAGFPAIPEYRRVIYDKP